MEVILEKMNSQVYAIRPQVEKVQGQNYMKINYEGCTHILLLCRDREWLPALHYLLTTIALCMGYFVLAV